MCSGISRLSSTLSNSLLLALNSYRQMHEFSLAVQRELEAFGLRLLYSPWQALCVPTAPLRPPRSATSNRSYSAFSDMFGLAQGRWPACVRASCALQPTAACVCLLACHALSFSAAAVRAGSIASSWPGALAVSSMT